MTSHFWGGSDGGVHTSMTELVLLYRDLAVWPFLRDEGRGGVENSERV